MRTPPPPPVTGPRLRMVRVSPSYQDHAMRTAVSTEVAHIYHLESLRFPRLDLRRPRNIKLPG